MELEKALPGMNRVLAPRASAILYNLLVDRQDPRPFLLPANICPIVPVTFLKARQSFEFVDISPLSLGMQQEAVLERARGGALGGVLYPHTYGDPATPAGFFTELKQLDPSLLLIDDRCLCIPDLEPDPSNPADVLLYSTGYSKIVDLGFGGYAFLADHLAYRPNSLPFLPDALEEIETAYKKAVARREPFLYQDGAWLEVGGDLPGWAGYNRQIQKTLSRSLDHRRAINAVYSACLPVEIQLAPDQQLWRFNIRVPDQQRMLERLFAAKLFASAHYASLAGIMAPGHCPEAERLAGEVINLFNDHHFTTGMAERTAAIIMELL